MKSTALHFLAFSLLIASRGPAQSVTVQVLPTQPLIERSNCCALLNFDFELTTTGSDTLPFESIEATLLDSNGKVIGYRHVNTNGMIPSVNTLSATRVVPGQVATVYNPFFSFDRKIPVISLKYRFELKA